MNRDRESVEHDPLYTFKRYLSTKCDAITRRAEKLLDPGSVQLDLIDLPDNEHLALIPQEGIIFQEDLRKRTDNGRSLLYSLLGLPTSPKMLNNEDVFVHNPTHSLLREVAQDTEVRQSLNLIRFATREMEDITDGTVKQKQELFAMAVGVGQVIISDKSEKKTSENSQEYKMKKMLRRHVLFYGLNQLLVHDQTQVSLYFGLQKAHALRANRSFAAT